MSKQISIPGLYYSILLAAGAAVVEYFTSGEGMGVPWASIAIAIVPVALKGFTTKLAPTEDTAAPRSRSGLESVSQPPQPRSKMNQFLFG